MSHSENPQTREHQIRDQKNIEISSRAATTLRARIEVLVREFFGKEVSNNLKFLSTSPEERKKLNPKEQDIYNRIKRKFLEFIVVESLRLKAEEGIIDVNENNKVELLTNRVYTALVRLIEPLALELAQEQKQTVASETDDGSSVSRMPRNFTTATAAGFGLMSPLLGAMTLPPENANVSGHYTVSETFAINSIVDKVMSALSADVADLLKNESELESIKTLFETAINTKNGIEKVLSSVQEQEVQEGEEFVELSSATIDQEYVNSVSDTVLKDLLQNALDIDSEKGMEIIDLNEEQFLKLEQSDLFSEPIRGRLDILLGEYKSRPENYRIELHVFQNQNDASTVVVPLIVVKEAFTVETGNGVITVAEKTQTTVTETGTTYIIPNEKYEGKSVVGPYQIDAEVLSYLKNATYIDITVNTDSIQEGDIVFVEMSPNGRIVAIVTNSVAIRFYDPDLPDAFEPAPTASPTPGLKPARPRMVNWGGADKPEERIVEQYVPGQVVSIPEVFKVATASKKETVETGNFTVIDTLQVEDINFVLLGSPLFTTLEMEQFSADFEINIQNWLKEYGNNLRGKTVRFVMLGDSIGETQITWDAGGRDLPLLQVHREFTDRNNTITVFNYMADFGRRDLNEAGLSQSFAYMLYIADMPISLGSDYSQMRRLHDKSDSILRLITKFEPSNPSVQTRLIEVVSE